MKRHPILACAGVLLTAWSSAQAAEIVPGAVWYDARGAVIQAHGGGILKHGDTWFWYGEDRRNGICSSGISCYSSKDLVQWRNEGVVCESWALGGRSIVPNTPAKFRSGPQCPILERPKVLHCERTRKFVMWMHMEERGYKLSNAAVAVSDSPTGPFRFIDCFRPVPGELHRQYSDRSDADQFERGSTFRDMTLFKDDDGKAWVIYAAESNYTMHIALLTDDYQGVRPPVQGKTWNRILVEEHREAPAIFKHAGSYYLITSGCKGWQPTEARLSVSTTILGPYRKVGNPCRGKNARTTFDSQGTFVLPIEPDKGRFMFMADRWNPKSIRDSTYVWLPLLLMDGKSPVIEWADRWSP